MKWFREQMNTEKVSKVVLTKRMTSEPLVLSSPSHGISANLYRIMRCQALGSDKQMEEVKRILEINPLHPLIDEIFKRIKVDPQDKSAEDLAFVLFDVATLQSGFDVADSQALARRVNRILRQSVDIAADAPLLEEDPTEFAVDVAEEETEKAATEEPAAATEEEVAAE